MPVDLKQARSTITTRAHLSGREAALQGQDALLERQVRVEPQLIWSSNVHSACTDAVAHQHDPVPLNITQHIDTSTSFLRACVVAVHSTVRCAYSMAALCHDHMQTRSCNIRI